MHGSPKEMSRQRRPSCNTDPLDNSSFSTSVSVPPEDADAVFERGETRTVRCLSAHLGPHTLRVRFCCHKQLASAGVPRARRRRLGPTRPLRQPLGRPNCTSAGEDARWVEALRCYCALPRWHMELQPHASWHLFSPWWCCELGAIAFVETPAMCGSTGCAT